MIRVTIGLQLEIKGKVINKKTARTQWKLNKSIWKVHLLSPYFIHDLMVQALCQVFIKYLLHTWHYKDERNNRTKRQVSEFPGSPVFRTQELSLVKPGFNPWPGT